MMRRGNAGRRSDPGVVTVVGSTNLDIVIPVDRLPSIGQTVVGGDHYRVAGGKGSNQAVACARLGARSRFVGCVGDDGAGRVLLDAMIEDGVDTSFVRQLADTPSGIALIVVAADGENTVTVSPGANALLGPADIPEAALADADAVLIQLEIALSTAVAAATRAPGLVVLNPAPARELPRTLLEATDVLVPNRSELATLAGVSDTPQTIDEIIDLARGLEVSDRLVVTLGADGALVLDHGEMTKIDALEIAAVDATGAGDTFCAAMTVALVEGAPLADAAAWAVIAAGLSVARRGAQPSLPTRAEVDAVQPR